MNLRKHLLATARLVLPTTGLGLICVGAYVNSLKGEEMNMIREIFTYLLIILGFVLLVVGVLWSIGHGVKGVLVKWSGGRTRHNDVHVFTVDRTNFPPSYEESEVRMEAAGNTELVPVVPRWPGLAPPVYSENFQICTEDYSHEDPPTYQQAVSQNHDQSHSQILNQSPIQSLSQSQNQNHVASMDHQAILQNQVASQTATSLPTNISIEPF